MSESPSASANISIRELKSQADQPAMAARVWVQVDSVQEKESRNGKPFLEIRVVDAEDGFTLRAWSDSPIFSAAGTLQRSSVAELDGDWTQNEWGIDAQRLAVRSLAADEGSAVLRGLC